jgi:hypothetical protein
MIWDEFHRRAKDVVPQQKLKERRCWIGVLDHRKSAEDEFKETDFIWMIGHSVSSTVFPLCDVTREACAERVEIHTAPVRPYMQRSANTFLENPRAENPGYL